MTPKACPICGGRRSVPASLYAGELAPDWEPGELPPMISEAGTAEAGCLSCDGTGIVWPPGSMSMDPDYFQDQGMWSYSIPTGGRVSVSGLFGWDTDVGTVSSLKLVEDEDED